MVFVKFLLLTQLGLHIWAESAMDSDCFMDYLPDKNKYKNMLIEESMISVVHPRCTDDDTTDGINKDQLGKMNEAGKQSNQSIGQCHLISKSRGDRICKIHEGPYYYEYPKVTRREPGNVGDVKEVLLRSRKTHKLITKAVNPPVFEIPSFFSQKECDYIIAKAKENGMMVSGVVGLDINDEFKSNKSLTEVVRVSHTSWLEKDDLGVDFWLKLRKRVSKLTLLPLPAVKQSESIQVVQYQPGGHYHAHLDSTDDNYTLPCCFQKPLCMAMMNTIQWYDCCRMCRYITVMVYLNDTEEGGETAFPFADVDDATLQEEMLKANWSNLSSGCHKSSLLVTPEKGKAVFWYNHGVNETGYIGEVIKQSNHGGCDVIKGSKWIANFWLLWPSYEDRTKMSRFSTEAVNIQTYKLT